MTVKPLNLEAILHICRNLRESSRIEVGDKTTEDLVERIVAADLSRSYHVSLDEPIYMGGAIPAGPKLWTMWGLATERFSEIAIPLTRFVKRDIIAPLLAEGCALQSLGIGGYPDIARWMKFIGAKPAETLNINGKDFVLYRWDLA